MGKLKRSGYDTRGGTANESGDLNVIHRFGSAFVLHYVCEILLRFDGRGGPATYSIE